MHSGGASASARKKSAFRGALFSSGQESGQITLGKFWHMCMPNSCLCSKGTAWNSEMYTEVMQKYVRWVNIHTHTHKCMYLCGYCLSFMKLAYIDTQFQSYTEVYFVPS